MNFEFSHDEFFEAKVVPFGSGLDLSESFARDIGTVVGTGVALKGLGKVARKQNRQEIDKDGKKKYRTDLKSTAGRMAVDPVGGAVAGGGFGAVLGSAIGADRGEYITQNPDMIKSARNILSKANPEIAKETSAQIGRRIVNKAGKTGYIVGGIGGAALGAGIGVLGGLSREYNFRKFNRGGFDHMRKDKSKKPIDRDGDGKLNESCVDPCERIPRILGVHRLDRYYEAAISGQNVVAGPTKIDPVQNMVNSPQGSQPNYGNPSLQNAVPSGSRAATGISYIKAATLAADAVRSLRSRGIDDPSEDDIHEEMTKSLNAPKTPPGYKRVFGYFKPKEH